LNKEQVLSKLNWFYSLELSQVDLYMEQSKKIDDIYLTKVFERASYIEQQHVDNIAMKIKELGGKPTFLGDVIGPISGKIGGNLLTRTGIISMLKANILLEQKAMTDYQDFILGVGKDFGLSDILWSNLIDEDFHTSWFTSKVQKLEKDL